MSDEESQNSTEAEESSSDELLTDLNPKIAKRKKLMKGKEPMVPKRQKKRADKRVVTQPKIKKRTMTTKYPRINIRNLPKLWVETVAKLSDQHKEWIRSMGFYNLIALKITHVPHYMGYYVVDSFDEVSCELKLHDGKSLHITEDDVHAVLGVPKGPNAVITTKNKGDGSMLKAWMELIQKGKKDNKDEQDKKNKKKKATTEDTIRPADIADQLQKCEDEVWFRRHFVAFFISLFVESNQNGTINQSLFVEDVTNVASLNWCSFVLKRLIQTKIAWNKNKEKRFFTGPILFLMLFYVHRVNILGEKLESIYPVFLNWNDEKLKKRQKDEDLFAGSFGHGHVQQKPVDLVVAFERGSEENNPTHAEKEAAPPKPRAEEKIEVWEEILKEKAENVNMAVGELEEALLEMPDDFVQDESIKVHLEECRRQLQDAEIIKGMLESMLDNNKDNEETEANERAQQQTRTDVDQERPQQEKDDNVEQGREEVTNLEQVKDINENVEQTRDEEINEEQGKGANENEETETDEDVRQLKPRKKKGKKMVITEEATTKEACAKRERKLADAVKSPYYKRSVTIRNKFVEDENAMWAYVFSDIGSEERMGMLYRNKNLSVHKVQFRSIDMNVLPCVIDAWSLVLNNEEKAKSDGKPLRLFGYVIRSDVEFTIATKDEFTSRMKIATDILNGSDTKEVDMILIPVLFEPDHYILVSFNLKKPGIEIIDSMVRTNEREEMYEKVTKVLIQILVHYLDMRKLYAKKKKINDPKLKPKIVHIPWREDRKEASGIYTMRAMEMYMGVEAKNWEDEMTTRNALQSVKMLRVKYLSKILTSETNEMSKGVAETVGEYKHNHQIMKPVVKG